MKSKQWRRIHARPVGIDVSQDQPIRYSTEDGRWRRNPRARIDLRSMQGVIGTSALFRTLRSTLALSVPR